jgi:hypothetical protein
MAPGCCTNVQTNGLNPADTVDSFEILEQTVMKQKRLAKKKKSDLRLRILLKRTFDLVCEIMDRENGFDDDYIDSSNNSSKINNDCSNYSDSKTTTITNINDIEAIPLPDDDINNNKFESVQLVPDEQNDNMIKFDDNKDYHMLTNVNFNEDKCLKRKFDDTCSSQMNNCNNKKLKLIDVGLKVKIKNEM